MRLPSRLQRVLVFPGSLLPEPKSHRLTRQLLRIAGPDGARIALYHRLAHGSKLHVLFFYGNAMTVADCEPIADGFASTSVGVSIPDYLGYGLSDGTASEHACYATAQHVIAHLMRDHGISSRRLVIAGWSLGAAVALQATLRYDPAGLIMFSPFRSLAAAARQVVPIMPAMLARALIGGAFDNLSRIKAVRCPLLIAHGEADRLLPFRMSEELYANAVRAGCNARLLRVPRADHGDLFAVGGEPLWREVGAFLRNLG